ncbi:scopoletin glucosyltransferase-like [Heracleum sosnowskyi]|uniref:Glycosyltransferase n=1 Tax=Heracleum sosnowskyi TaxID=360622 RepID=A0AAD8N2G3_9APIA|nr:scopoletin glucosyltransferase-like [Heracleum sosnowskyi]
MGTNDQIQNLHVLILPYLTPSHMIPLVTIGRLFAARGVTVTILTTPCNALLLRSSIDQDLVSDRKISIHELTFPTKEVGLPEGIENFNAVTSSEMSTKVFYGIMLLRKPMEDFIRKLSPNCIFSDMFYPWTADLANELNIPRLMFYPSSFLYHCVTHSLSVYAPHDTVESETESFLVPNLPHKIEMKRCQLQEHVKVKTRYGELIKAIKESEKKSYGMVHDTFYELEPAYTDHYGKVKKSKFWHIGPIFQFFKKAETFRGSSFEQHYCLSWLDTQKPDSVLYICFGSIVRFSDAQLTEIALALEASNIQFIWVVRKGVELQETWLPSGFEERMVKKNKGLLVREWVPQVKILDHSSTGGFMTHCGWNSVLEAAVAGVPLVTWPLFAEQFYNEKLVELLKVGVRVGADVWNSGFEIESPLVGREMIENALSRLMDGSDESLMIRRRAQEIAHMARGAVLDAGSSLNQLTDLIEEMKALT